MLRVLICDDNEKHLAIMQRQIEKHIINGELAMKVVCASKTPEEILKYLEDKPGFTGLYFLDYHLKSSMDGLQLGEAIRKIDSRGFIVYVTSDVKSHRLTFKYKLEAMDYIVKDDEYLVDRLRECLYNAMEKYNAKATTLLDNSVFTLAEDVKSILGFNRQLGKGAKVSIENDKILCFKTETYEKHMVTVYMKDDRFKFGGSLKQVEANMDKRFYRCQNNLIVNLDKITAIEPKGFSMTLLNDLTFDISERTIKKLVDKWIEHNQGK